ncbi:MAG: aldehyde dehydrogenase EutE, partial [Aureliella sp.]
EVGEGSHRHLAPTKELLGQDAAKLAAAAGVTVDPKVELLYGETREDHPFVSVEQMMPFVPFVRCRDFDHAVELAKRYEHGYRHTSMIHSSDVRRMTKMARVMDTTLFIKNGPCMAGLGLGGEGYLSFSIAGPTGEGVTTPLTFTRERRCTLVDDLWVLGNPSTGN